MGLLDRLLGRKPEFQFDPGDWTVFHRDSGYGPLIIMLTEAYMRVGPDANRPAHILLRLYLKEPNENGMPFGRELKTIEAITDRVDASGGGFAVMVARATGNGRREFHFYAPSAEGFMDSLRKELARFKDYQYDLADDHDPQWNAYRALCPTPREQRETSDRSVVMQLAEHGDRAELPRKVDHFVDFPSAEARAAFQQAVVAQGFAIEDASQDREDDGSLRYKLHVTRVDPVKIEHIVPITEWLEATAKHYGGDYDGWGCPVTT